MTREWVILRTGAKATFGLAGDLRDEGLRAWTPEWTRRIRVPRARAIRVVTEPLIPGFVFAGAEALWALIDLCDPQKGAWRFRVMRHGDMIPRVQDHELEGLRAIEEETRREPGRSFQGPAFQPGDEVAVGIKSFEGMIGVIQSEQRGAYVVDFRNGTAPLRIQGFLLIPIGIQNVQRCAA